MEAEVFSVRIYHKEADQVEYKYEIEKGVRDYEAFRITADPNVNLTAWVIKNRKEVILNDYKNEVKKYAKDSKIMIGETPDSLLLVPIVIGDRVLGAMTVQAFVCAMHILLTISIS